MPKNNVLAEVGRQAKRAYVASLMRSGRSRAEVARELGLTRQAVQTLLGKEKKP